MRKLDRSVSLTGVLIICISGMLGSGIFVLPGLVYQSTGPSLWLAYLIAAFGVLPTVFSKSELATAMPTSGGTYVYIERTLGPLAGVIAGLGLWMSLLLKCSFALIGFGAYLSVFTNIDILYASLSLLASITVLNILGVGKVAGTLFVVVVISILTLVGISLLSIPSISLDNLSPLFTGGVSGLFSTAATVLISYAGVTKIAAIAEEVKDPGNNLPKGMLYSLVITAAIYCSVSVVLAGVLGEESLNGNLMPFFSLGEIVGGHILATVLSAVAILTMTSMANSGLLAASRFPYAMGRDSLLPSFLGTISRRFVTPTASILASSAIVAISIIVGNVEKIVKVASAFMIIMFVAVNLSVIILREVQVQWYRPHYKSPLYPFMQMFGSLSGIFLLWNMGEIVLKAIVFVSIPGLLIFLFYSRKKMARRGVVGIRGKRADLVVQESEPMRYCPSFRSHAKVFRASINAQAIVALFGRTRSPDMLFEMSVALTDGQGIEVAHITEVPEQTELGEISAESASLRSFRRRVTSIAKHKGWMVTFDPIVTHDIMKTIYDISLRLHCQWLTIEWVGKKRGAFTFYSPIGWLKNHLKCNLAVFCDKGIHYVKEIMALVDNEEKDRLVVTTADQLAKVYTATVTLVRYGKRAHLKEHRQEEEDYLKLLSQEVSCPCRYIVTESDNELDSIINQTIDFDLLVFGGSQHHFIDHFIPVWDDKVMVGAACSVISVQKCYDPVAAIDTTNDN